MDEGNVCTGQLPTWERPALVGDGNDTLRSGSVADVIDGGAGADFITGGYGVDRLTGGDEADYFTFWSVLDPGSKDGPAAYSL